MNVIVVDDERIILTTLTNAVARVMPKANVSSFRSSQEALDYAADNRIDIAFLDINMKGIGGITLAKKLQALNERLNVIFCTGYSEYSLEALDLYCSGYLLKPVTDEKIEKAISNLRFPVSDKIPGLRFQCFGNFEVLYNGQPLSFKNKRTKELLAFLVDRKGTLVSTNDILVALFEEDGKESYVRNLRSDLYETFSRLGISEALLRQSGDVGIAVEKVDCDYYDYLNGNPSLFRGEYMSQYSFADITLASLERDKQ